MRFDTARSIMFHIDTSRYVDLPIDPIPSVNSEGKLVHIVNYTRDEEGSLKFITQEGDMYLYTDLLGYNPRHDGAVTAIRIFMPDGHTPFATLTFAFGGSVAVEWDIQEIRKIFEPGINAYTIVYDTRANQSFTKFVTKTFDGFEWPKFNKEVNICQ